MESITAKEGKFGRDMQVVFDNWKSLYNACVVYVDHLDVSYSKAMAMNEGNFKEDEQDPPMNDTTEPAAASSSIDLSSYEYSADSKVFDL